MDQTNLYILVGSFVVVNIGTIGSVVFTLLKFSFSMGEAKAKLDVVAKDVDAAHKFIREIKDGKRRDLE